LLLEHTLRTLPAGESHSDAALARVNGFSLHAGVWAGVNDRAKLERLCHYIARPAVSHERIALTECGHVRYTLKTPYRDGTTHFFSIRWTSSHALPHWCRSRG
jgi:hypothetical protein